MIKVYLAGRYSRREELRVYAHKLTSPLTGNKELQTKDGSQKFEVTSRWLTGKHEPPCAQILGAGDDLHDVEHADWLVFFSEQPGVEERARGGRHVEFGFFIATAQYDMQRKRIFVIAPEGYKENIFHHLLPEGCFYSSFEDWVERYARFAEVGG